MSKTEVVAVFSPPIDNLKRDLDRLSDVLKDKAVKSGLRSAAVPVKRAMRGTVPKKTGLLASSISHKLIRGSPITPSRDDFELLVGPTKRVSVSITRSFRGEAIDIRKRWSMGWLANILEAGADPHKITARKVGNRSGTRGYLKIGQTFVREVQHPGIRPRWWMRRSLETSSSSIDDAFYVGMARELDKVK